MGTSVGGATVTRHSSGSVMARATGGVGAEPQFRSGGGACQRAREVGGSRAGLSPGGAGGEGGDRGEWGVKWGMGIG